MNENNNILPKHWQIKKLRDVCKELQSGKRPKGGVQGIESGIPSLGAEHLNYSGGFKFEKIKFVPKDFAEQMIKGIIKNDDIIIVKDGATTGKTSFVGNDFPYKYAVINEHVFIVRLTNEVLPKFAFYRLFCSTGHKEILEDFRGAAQGGISSGFLDKVNIPYPKISEQQAIVSKIEELLSDLENGKQQLITAQQQLKVYRQSLLKWAFEGKLTKNNVKGGELPKGWMWKKLKDIALEISDGDHQAPPKASNGIPFITISNVNKTSNRIDFTDTFSVKKDYYLNLKANRKPQKGDVLYTVTGSFGIPVLIDFEKEFCFQRHIGLVRPLNTVDQKWVYYLLQSPQIFIQAEKSATGTAQKTVALGSLRNFTIPFCPIKEQQLIVEELESKLTVCDKIEETITNSLQQTETLRQSILKMAFEGRLV
jgi:type I restriction enzyme, S subunit